MASQPSSRTPLSSILPPLIFGTATFNTQYNKDPYALDTKGLVKEALDHGVRAFDTSPYYGPAEILLGAALDVPDIRARYARREYFILTKVGRIAAEEFDYSPEWVRSSVDRSLERLKTDYLDVVYCHDVEFVSEEEVLGAVKELRRLRDEERKVKYIGISGYPVDVLCSLAARVLRETGEPLDAVMSYANFTLQNTLLETQAIPLLKQAGVDVVPNASMLGMGLLRHDGQPEGAQGDWHPSPLGLRRAVQDASDFCDRHDERIEVIAIRYALESYVTVGSIVGSSGDPASGVPWKEESIDDVGGGKLGVSVMGVSNSAELKKTMQVWRSILDGLEGGEATAMAAGRWRRDHEWSLNRKKAVQILADGVKEVMDKWLDFTWESPHRDYVNVRGKTTEQVYEAKEKLRASALKQVTVAAMWPTPAASPEPVSEDRRFPFR
ncbi:Aldo/keto reductase [Eremomyces bilateralis CBS 781.70]|uniref:Aldo/keto reductase n=1 Tax=Eremomyces bilateralis CBS 781.70 TaxID=1392243 RepID=A0A6G1G4U8_9PEZI|nr:Aldo/keto reductase [Eremomyces bilateralis CBS 781.70]KAF1812859.1 Aldo/keto reductase [Eremomyces bilateralis CBS 781.70]